MFLVDANVFLEALLEQERTESVRSFLQSADLEELHLQTLLFTLLG